MQLPSHPHPWRLVGWRTVEGVAIGVAIALAPLGSALAVTETPCTKTLAWSEDPPNTMRLPTGEVGGVEVDLHRELLRTMGCELHLVEMPFARALVALQTGDVDVIAATLDRPERRSYALFSKPVLYLHNVLYVRKADAAKVGNRRLAALVDEGWRLGGQIGVVYGSEFVALLNDPVRSKRLVHVPLRPSLWKMLEIGRLDGVMANQLTASHELAAMGMTQRLVPTAIQLPVESGGSAWSRRTTDEAFVRRFDATLIALQKSKRYGDLLAPYGLTPSGQLAQPRP